MASKSRAGPAQKLEPAGNGELWMVAASGLEQCNEPGKIAVGGAASGQDGRATSSWPVPQWQTRWRSPVAEAAVRLFHGKSRTQGGRASAVVSAKGRSWAQAANKTGRETATCGLIAAYASSPRTRRTAGGARSARRRTKRSTKPHASGPHRPPVSQARTTSRCGPGRQSSGYRASLRRRAAAMAAPSSSAARGCGRPSRRSGATSVASQHSASPKRVEP